MLPRATFNHNSHFRTLIFIERVFTTDWLLNKGSKVECTIFYINKIPILFALYFGVLPRHHLWLQRKHRKWHPLSCAQLYMAALVLPLSFRRSGEGRCSILGKHIWDPPPMLSLTQIVYKCCLMIMIAPECQSSFWELANSQDILIAISDDLAEMKL